VFSSLLNSLKAVIPLPLFVFLQDPPVFHNRLPSFARFKAFAPEMLNGVPPKVVCYVRYGILQTYHILPVFFECPDWMVLDVHTPSGFFDSNHYVLSFYNGYSSNGTSAYVRSFTLEKIF